MSRPLRVAALVCCAVLLSACAGLPEPRSVIDTPVADTTETFEDEAGYDWLVERARIGADLGMAHGIEAQAMDDGALLVRLPAAEGFARNSAAPTPTLRSMLDRVAQILADAPETELKVLGHTDSIGSELHNLRLSIQRAEAVMEYLRGRGIALVRLSADGRGEAEPIADNVTEYGRATNRRVELIVRPFH